jgi:tetratricopeptide (TPR) repeat protein
MATLVIIVLTALLLSTNGYFLYFRPQMHRAALLTILPLLDSETPRDLTRAEADLSRALALGLGRRDTGDARFALAWTQAKLGRFDTAKYGEALTTLAAADSAAGGDPDAADLRFWLLAQLGRHDEIRRTAEQHPELAERPRIRPLYADALVHRAHDLWTRLDFDGAVEAAKQASRLGVDSQVVEILLEQGMRAIMAEDLTEAERCFTRAEESAGAGVQRIEARLGRLACRWHRSGEDSVLDVLAEEFDGLSRRAEQRGQERDDARQLRAHVGWWYLVAMLEDWLRRLPVGQGLPTAERERFLMAVRSVNDADPDLGEVIMMHGLLEYGGADTRETTAAALAILDRSTRTAKGIVLPEVRGIIDGRRATAARGRGDTDDWSGAAPPTGTSEPADYPVPPVAVSLEALFEQARSQMTSNPEVRAAVEQLFRTMGFEGPR